MVRCCVAGCVLAILMGGPALADPDWRGAGGAIFVAARATDSPTADVAEAIPQLAASGQRYEAEVSDAAARHRIDPKLLHALVVIESSYQPRAVSPAGAAGLTQLMPHTATALGVTDRFDAKANLLGGADYLARQLLRFGDVRLALAAYNSGPARVARLGRVPAIAETQQYVTSVIDCYLALSAGRTVRTARDCRSVDP